VSKYLLDANVFIEAQQRYYAHDICPGFWTILIELHKDDLVESIDRIRSELVSHDDYIRDWVEMRVPKTFFKGTADQAVINRFGEIMRWVNAQAQFTDPAKVDFAGGADAWLIAYASVNRLTVITHEVYAPEARSKVHIPNVCLEFETEYSNTFQMLRATNSKLIRSTKS